MKLGAFSVSLTVNDINASKAFYEKLGFTVFGGDIEQHWLIMKNDTATIGLFQGMFDSNIMTFNPGWDSTAQNVDSFTDIRDMQKEFLDKGISVAQQIEEGTSGPASFMVTDPDGNTILFDQHR